MSTMGQKQTSDAVRGLDPPEQHQNENDDQNRADETNAAMTVTVSIAAEAPAESAQQEDDKDNYKNKSQRHDLMIPPLGRESATEFELMAQHCAERSAL